MAAVKSIVNESKDIERAVALIGLGARLQVLESETSLSYEKLLKLYKEVAGKSPSKGQLPFSTDWFLSWQPNIHSSLFANIAEYLNKTVALDSIDVVMKAYKLYEEQMTTCGIEPLLSFTRAWRLSKFMDAGMLEADPYAIEREAIIEVPDDDIPGGWLPMHGMVPRLSGTPGVLARPAPRIGEHNHEILAPVLGDAELARLRDLGVVREAAGEGKAG